jgi:hypothetical protein
MEALRAEVRGALMLEGHEGGRARVEGGAGTYWRCGLDVGICLLSAEELGVDLVERVAADVTVAVAIRSAKEMRSDSVLAECIQHLM